MLSVISLLPRRLVAVVSSLVDQNFPKKVITCSDQLFHSTVIHTFRSSLRGYSCQVGMPTLDSMLEYQSEHHSKG